MSCPHRDGYQRAVEHVVDAAGLFFANQNVRCRKTSYQADPDQRAENPIAPRYDATSRETNPTRLVEAEKSDERDRQEHLHTCPSNLHTALRIGFPGEWTSRRVLDSSAEWYSDVSGGHGDPSFIRSHTSSSLLKVPCPCQSSACSLDAFERFLHRRQGTLGPQDGGQGAARGAVEGPAPARAAAGSQFSRARP